MAVLEEAQHELQFTVLFLEEAKVGVLFDSAGQVNFLDRVCKSSREKIGRHVDAFFVLDFEVIFQHSHLQTVQSHFVQMP